MARTMSAAITAAENELNEAERTDRPAGVRRGQTTRRRTAHAGPHPPTSACLGNGIWQTASWTRENAVFEQDLNERTCTCEAGQQGLWCRHLTSAFLSSLAVQVGLARDCAAAGSASFLRACLKKGTHQTRPDIEMACLLVAWEEAKAAWATLQATAIGDEPPPEGGPVALAPTEYRAAVELLSEGRKVA